MARIMFSYMTTTPLMKIEFRLASDTRRREGVFIDSFFGLGPTYFV